MRSEGKYISASLALSLSLSIPSIGLHYHFSAEYIVPIFTELSTERWVCQDQTWEMINREKVGSLSLPSSVMTIVIIMIHLTVSQSPLSTLQQFLERHFISSGLWTLTTD